MTLDYTKMFLIVTEEAVVKGHFAFIIHPILSALRGVIFFAAVPACKLPFNGIIKNTLQQLLEGIP